MNQSPDPTAPRVEARDDIKGVAGYYYPLFQHMHDEHNLTLVGSEMDEIIRLCAVTERNENQKLSAELAAAKAVIKANDEKELERAGNPFDSPQFELRQKLLEAEAKEAATSSRLAELERELAASQDDYKRLVHESDLRLKLAMEFLDEARAQRDRARAELAATPAPAPEDRARVERTNPFLEIDHGPMLKRLRSIVASATLHERVMIDEAELRQLIALADACIHPDAARPASGDAGLRGGAAT